MSFNLDSSTDITNRLAARVKKMRLRRNITQAELAIQAGISLSSLKRFESKGLASLDLVARIALIFNTVEAFDELFSSPEPRSIDDLIVSEPRRRARKLR